MKIATGRKTKPQAGFEDEYRSSLREYAAGGGEVALGRAYELGRRALTEQKSLVEMASLHHQAVLALVREVENEKQREELVRASGEGPAAIERNAGRGDQAHRIRRARRGWTTARSGTPGASRIGSGVARVTARTGDAD